MRFLSEVFERFCKAKPISVMYRMTIENVFSTDRLNAIFEENAERQYVGELMFSTVCDIMGQVACKIRPSVNSIYVEQKEEIGVTIKSVYDKLGGIELPVSRALVRETAIRIQAIIKQTGGIAKPMLDGYRTKIVDGNHLRRTDRRIGELREVNGAPLPGHAMVIYDPQYRLVQDVILCEDGHDQERTLFPEVMKIIEANDLWIADRNFCTIGFLGGIAKRRGKFIIRQHGTLPYTLKGRRWKVGETETGIVYEQAMEVPTEDGGTLVYRRVTIHLYKETRDQDVEVHIVTNLPKRVGAVRIASLYRGRWKIETAFQEIAENLAGENKTLGYPKAALFGFCMALVTYNILSVVRAAVHAVHGEENANEFSTYYAALDVSSTHAGMTVILDKDFWHDRYARLTPTQIAAELKRLAHEINLSKFKKGKWKPKKEKKKLSKQRRPHVSTKRIIEDARKTADPAT